jgi:hypothetical protein
MGNGVLSPVEFERQHKAKAEGVQKTRGGLQRCFTSQVIRLCEEIDERVQAFLDRPIEGDWPYHWIDATDVRGSRQSGSGRCRRWSHFMTAVLKMANGNLRLGDRPADCLVHVRRRQDAAIQFRYDQIPFYENELLTYRFDVHQRLV